VLKAMTVGIPIPAILGILISLAVPSCTSAGSVSPDANSSRLSLTDTCITNPAAPLALVIGARSNVPKPQLPAFVNTLLQDAANAGHQISIIGVDGQPSVVAPPPFSSSAGNSAARQSDLTNYLNEYFGPLLNGGKDDAQHAQANVLAALDLAAEATSPDGNIVVVDSGLQTVAPLQYQASDLLAAQSSDVVAFLQKQGLLPHLTGRHVVLDGFGYTAAPQPQLDQAQQDNVRSQWEAIVKAGGGCVTVDTLPSTAAAISGLPPVAVVTPVPPPTFTNCGTTALGDAGTVGFVVGTAIFRDPTAAQATLSQLAAKLKQGTEHVILIGGTSTEGGDAINNPLSLKRANAIAKVLEKAGIPAARITTRGDGSHWPGRAADTGPGGVLLPGPAEQDREVIVQLPPCS